MTTRTSAHAISFPNERDSALHNYGNCDIIERLWDADSNELSLTTTRESVPPEKLLRRQSEQCHNTFKKSITIFCLDTDDVLL